MATHNKYRKSLAKAKRKFYLYKIKYPMRELTWVGILRFAGVFVSSVCEPPFAELALAFARGVGGLVRRLRPCL